MLLFVLIGYIVAMAWLAVQLAAGFQVPLDPSVLTSIVVGVLSPVVLKYFPKPWKDTWMALFVFVFSFVIALAITFVTGGTEGWSWAKVAVEFTVLYTSQQLVFSAFKTQLNLPDPNPPKTLGIG